MANRVAQRMGPIGPGKHRIEVARDDRRWLLAWAGIFVGTLALLVVAHQLYRMTGPHPEITAAIRSLKHQARWLIPGLKGKPHARGAAVDPDHRSVDSTRSGQAAQRA
ncbi:MAG TPA: hypothetical protein VGR62_15385 [Candidatus Binatia bacterium]|jgi:hypothetical protein|nr:hypothetical protein [Candidatus Binatia bacterium]